MKARASWWASLLALAAVTTLLARARAPSTLEVDYYYIPYCLSCARVLEGLRTLEHDFGPRVRLHTADCFSESGKQAAERYGFVTHGLVVRDSARGVIFEQKDHGVRADDVRAVLRGELAAR